MVHALKLMANHKIGLGLDSTEYLKTYLDGWQLGDGAMSHSATAPGFFYEDPNTGHIKRDAFIGFVEDFKASVAEMTGGLIRTPFLEYTHTIISERDAICWCWWHAASSDLEGAALIQFGIEGVISEKIAYFTKLPR